MRSLFLSLGWHSAEIVSARLNTASLSVQYGILSRPISELVLSTLSPFAMRFAWSILMMLVAALSVLAGSESTHWSLQPVVRPVPKARGAESGIDSFISTKLADTGLKMSGEA